MRNHLVVSFLVLALFHHPLSKAEIKHIIKPLTAGMTMPVLFFYGKTDWMVGPTHYEGVNFPNMILWGSDVGHMPFLENGEDLEKAITTYIRKYGF